MSRIDLGDNIRKPKTVPATVEGFNERVDSEKTGRICAELADALEQHLRGELSKEDYKTKKAELKIGAAFYTPHAHFKKGYKSGEGEPVDSGKAIIDVDGNPAGREVYTKRIMGRERELGINMFNISIGGGGFAVLFDIPEGLSRQQAQAWMANELGIDSYDKAVHEPERAVYIPCREYILYLDEDLMFGDELRPTKLSEEVLRKYSASDNQGQTRTSSHTDPNSPGKSVKRDAIIPVEPGARALAAFDETLKTTELDLETLNREGVRHNTLKLLLPTLCQMMPQEELLGVLRQRMPEYSKEQDCMTLVSNFYDKYVDLNRPMNLKQKEVFLKSLKAGEESAESPALLSQSPMITIDFKRMPIGLKESLKPYPQKMWPALVVGMMPALMALADGVSYRYCNGKVDFLGGMAIIIGEQASNKSCIEEAVERWLVDLRHDDELVREREDKVREANRQRKANERAQEAPKGVVRVVPITISCSKLLKRLKQSQGHCLYSICSEAETLLKSNGGGSWAQKWDIYRNAFGRERWGVDYNSDQSESGDVRVAYCWTILGTPRTTKKMFSGKNESNAENGLSSRMMLSEMPDGMFEKITVFNDLSDADMGRISQATAMLRTATGFYETPRLRKAIDGWLEDKRVEASMEMDIIKDRFRRRAGLIGFRCGVVFMLLAGKESSACVDFALKMAEYTLQMQLKVFRPLLAKHYADGSDTPSGTVNGNIFVRLPSPFSMQDLRQLKGSEIGDSGLYTIISRWKTEGWVEKNGKSWIKKKA
jgi:hypothetical protein